MLYEYNVVQDLTKMIVLVIKNSVFHVIINILIVFEDPYRNKKNIFLRLSFLKRIFWTNYWKKTNPNIMKLKLYIKFKLLDNQQ